MASIKPLIVDVFSFWPEDFNNALTTASLLSRVLVGGDDFVDDDTNFAISNHMEDYIESVNKPGLAGQINREYC